MYKKKVTIYHCSFCKKHYLNSAGCIAHEKVCFKNPANKACSTCEHGGDWVNYCGKTGDLLHGKEPVRHCKNWELLEEIKKLEDK